MSAPIARRVEHLSQQPLFYSTLHPKWGHDAAIRARNIRSSMAARGGKLFALSFRNVTQHASESVLGRMIFAEAFRREVFRDAHEAGSAPSEPRKRT